MPIQNPKSKIQNASKRSARIALHGEFVLRALGLPGDAKLVAAEVLSGENGGSTLLVQLEHEGLPEVDRTPLTLCPTIEFRPGQWPTLISWNENRPISG